MKLTFDPANDTDVELVQQIIALVQGSPADQADPEPEPEEEPKRPRDRKKPDPEPEEREEDEGDADVSLETLQEQAAEILTNFGRPTLVAALKKLGAKSLSSMDPEDYGRAQAYFTELLEEEG